jgi:peptidoglycan-N-acetylglucosamine deacetylase
MKNALSIDLEFWYSAELVRPYVKDENDLIVEMTRPLIDILDENGTKATFFVLGKVAEKYPDLIKEIHEKGHEIASHAYSHRTLYDLGKSGLEQEIKKSKCLLEKITGERLDGFRAPTFSLDNSTKWALDILDNSGFSYDSSLFPAKTALYGVSDAPLYPYRPSKENISKESMNSGRNIVEIPLSVYRLGPLSIPIAGGFYLRAMPFYLLETLIKQINKDRAAVIYIHPWELFPIMPKLDLSSSSKFITYYKVESTIKKFQKLLSAFQFDSIREVINEI